MKYKQTEFKICDKCNTLFVDKLNTNECSICHSEIKNKKQNFNDKKAFISY